MRWCVAQTKPHDEQVAVTNLRRQGFRVLTPTLREHRGQKVREILMFPSYVLIEIDPQALDWLAIGSTRGVKRLMTTCSERPSLLPPGWAEDLIARDGVYDVYVDDQSEFRRGEKLQFTDGPFKGYYGVCQWTDKKRVKLLFHLLGRETVIFSDPSILRRL